MAPPPSSVSYRQVNIIAFDDVCSVYGVDASQFEVGTIAFVKGEVGNRGNQPFFVLVDTGEVVDGIDVLSTVGGPLQPGCTNTVHVGTSNLRWRRLDTSFV